MKFFVILEILIIIARVAALIFSDSFPPEVVTALNWACGVVGAIAAVFIGVEIYCKIKGKSKKGD